jgi:hypothetical protein
MSSIKKLSLLVGLLLFSIVFAGCKKELSDENEILSFDIPNITCIVFTEGSEIFVSVYRNINISKLQPIIEVSPKAKVYPPSGTIMDFTYPVTYQVTAENGNIATYRVTVSNILSNQSDIQVFRLVGTEQIFERIRDSIFIYVPYETDITNIQTHIVVSDSVTVFPTSGTPMDFTTPQTYTTTSTDETKRNYIVTVKKSPWRKVGNAPFTRRDEIECLVFKDKLWVLAGWTGPTLHSGEVWNTSDGMTWEKIIDNAPWRAENTVRFVVFKDKLWSINGGVSCTEVWSSDDGANWTKELDTVPWGRRHNPYVAIFNDKIWLMGGHYLWESKLTSTVVFNDIWSSEDGINWILEREHAKWSARGLFYGQSVILNNNLFLYGGGIYTHDLWQTYNDVWVTSNGTAWNRVIPSAEWTRGGFASIAAHNNKLWILLGGDASLTGDVSYIRLSNEVWFSEDNGKSWQQLKHSFFPIRHASGFISFKDKLYIIAGYFHNDIWVLEE